MPIYSIQSPDDPRLAAYRHLKRDNATRWSGQFIAEGDKLVRRLLASPHEVLSLLLGECYVRRFEPLVAPQTPIYVVPDKLVEEIIGFNFHRGVLACGRRPLKRNLDGLLTNTDANVRLVVCAGIQNPENLGTLLRTSLSLQIDAAILSPNCGDPFSRRVLRTSMGATFQLPIIQVDSLQTALVELRERYAVELLATVTSPSALPLDQLKPGPRSAVLFGSEGHGLSPEVIELCDRQVTIPMSGATDSLNVAVAAGVVLYHLSPRGQDFFGR